MDYDAATLYLLALWVKNSVCPKRESGYSFKPHMINIFVNDFKIETFNEDGNDFAILKNKILQST